MATKTRETSPDKRRRYDEVLKTEILRLTSASHSTQTSTPQLSISPRLFYRWKQAQRVAEAGSVEVARDPEVRALRAANKRLVQELAI